MIIINLCNEEEDPTITLLVKESKINEKPEYEDPKGICSVQSNSYSSISLVTQTRTEIKEQIDNNILDCLNQNKTIKGDDYSFQVAFSNTLNTNVSHPSLNISACEALLRDVYDIPSTESLIILTMELERENSRTNQVEYSVYTEDGVKLDLSICENITISVSYPLTNTTGINFDKGQELKKRDMIFMIQLMIFIMIFVHLIR